MLRSGEVESPGQFGVAILRGLSTQLLFTAIGHALRPTPSAKPGLTEVTPKTPTAERAPSTPSSGAPHAEAPSGTSEAPKAAQEPPVPTRSPLQEDAPKNFGKPYGSKAEAWATRALLRMTFLPAARFKFGKDVAKIWSDYLSRSPGDSLEPRVFEGDHPIAAAFRDDKTVEYCQVSLRRYAKQAIIKQWDALVGTMKVGESKVIPLKELVGAQRIEMGQRMLNFSDKNTIPGNIAGDIGGSDAGPDQRFIDGTVTLTRQEPNRVRMVVKNDFVVKEAVDFIPGAPGDNQERNLTTPLSRLEATGMAYDVPFEVRFTGPVMEQTFTRWDSEMEE
jgi:hypothetical protein